MASAETTITVRVDEADLARLEMLADRMESLVRAVNGAERRGAERMMDAALRAIDGVAPSSGSPGWSWCADCADAVRDVDLDTLFGVHK